MSHANEVLETLDEDVVVETEQGNQVPISFQVMQSIYNEITGKSEELGKQIRRRYKAGYEDLVQLNAKVEQFLEQYHVTSKNMSVTVFHTKDNKEVYSSFERFSQYDRSKLCSVKYVHVEFNFLIKLPKADKVQNFKLDIKIGSAVPYMLKLKDDDMVGYVDESEIATAEIKIKYVDFVVAQGLMNVVEGWFDALEKSEPTPFQKFLKKNKDKIAASVKSVLIVSLVVLAFFVSSSLDNFFDGSASPSIYFKSVILVFFIWGVIFAISTRVEDIVSKSFREIFVISYLKLNRGDELDIERLEKSNQHNFKKGLFSLVFAISTGVASSLIAWLITS